MHFYLKSARILPPIGGEMNYFSVQGLIIMTRNSRLISGVFLMRFCPADVMQKLNLPGVDLTELTFPGIVIRASGLNGPLILIRRTRDFISVK